jgi:hypothetical protein
VKVGKILRRSEQVLKRMPSFVVDQENKDRFLKVSRSMMADTINTEVHKK